MYVSTKYGQDFETRTKGIKISHYFLVSINVEMIIFRYFCLNKISYNNYFILLKLILPLFHF